MTILLVFLPEASNDRPAQIAGGGINFQMRQCRKGNARWD